MVSRIKCTQFLHPNPADSSCSPYPSHNKNFVSICSIVLESCTHAYGIHRFPCILLCTLAVLTFGQPEHVGFDPTIIYLSPSSQISGNNTIQVGSATYSIIRQIFFNYLICGWGMTCWHVRRNGEDFVIKDSWTHKSRVNRKADILSKICGLKGVLQLVTAWTVQIEGSDDQTDA